MVFGGWVVRPAGRDLAVLRRVAEFRQLSSSHIYALAFHDRSGTVLDRCLLRLVRMGLLRRIGRMPSDMVKGGAGAFVYQLGSKGWALLDLSGRWRAQALNHHTLDVATAYMSLVQAERDGRLRIRHYQREVAVGRAQADLEVVLDLPDDGRLHSFVELDRDRQRPTVIQGKLNAYIEAWCAHKGAQFPRVLFLVPDELRKRQIENEVSRLPEHDQALFSVRPLGTFPQL